MPLSEFSAPLPRMPATRTWTQAVTIECDNPTRILTGGGQEPGSINEPPINFVP